MSKLRKLPPNVGVGAIIVLNQGIAEDTSNSRICFPVSSTQQAQPMMRWDKPKCMGEVSNKNWYVERLAWQCHTTLAVAAVAGVRVRCIL